MFVFFFSHALSFISLSHLDSSRSQAPSLTSRSSRCSRVYVNHLTHEGESACYLAAQRGHLEVVQLLLKAHADINQLTNDLSCPLYEPVSHGHTNVVELLVSKGAEVSRIHTESSWTCLHQAAYKGHTEIVRILVNKCNLEAVDDHRISPLFVAAQYGQRGCLEILVNADSVPCLSHICRLQVRALLGPDILMRTNVVQQLPVPNWLHEFLKFREIPEASYTHAPPSPISQRLWDYPSIHQHRHNHIHILY
ncbi:ankyrin repeat and SOCS box protein 3-like isoform X1 [Oreochromis aureus]|uniref:ankyrin repeat and SOCS box protein 3-like isoform X1 n=1 Tax=Oreochromis aureus TaxID=47969 RepID=UPI00195329AC|nr:ankyrin repeat and SOCS box protein 3-like isoform X1 [Oreochromis aureus]